MKSTKRRKQPDWTIAILLPSIWQKKRECKPSTGEIDQYKTSLNIDYDQVIVSATLDNLKSIKWSKYHASSCKSTQQIGQRIKGDVKHVQEGSYESFRGKLTVWGSQHSTSDWQMEKIVDCITLSHWNEGVWANQVYSVTGTKWNQQVYITMSQAMLSLALIHQTRRYT